MNYHIHLSPENTPETLPKLSLYTTEKPEEEDHLVYENGNKVLNNVAWIKAAESFEKSWVAYLKEPEWKMFDKPYRISDGEDTGHINTEESLQSVKESSEFSHYRPSQKVEASQVSYVRKPKIYVASSWRNGYQQGIVEYLRANNNDVYDFRNPTEGDHGFHWSEIDKNWEKWSVEEYQQALKHKVAVNGYSKDFNAMQWADICVLVLPCGRSAHTEAGWFAGQNKAVYVIMPQELEPELMYKIYTGGIYRDIESIDVKWQPAPEPERKDYRRFYSDQQFEKDHDQWLTDKSEGKVQAIQAVINQ